MEWLRRIWFLINRRRFEAELAREIETHRAMMDRPVQFGNALRIRDEARDVWGWGWLDDITRDLRLAARTLGRAPGFTVVVVASLALGFTLAASTAAVVNAYLIRALPFASAPRLYHVLYSPAGGPEPSGMTALDWSALSDVVDVADYSIPARFFLTDQSRPAEVIGLSVAPGSLDALGVRATVGRTLGEMDFRADADRVAMIGDELWHERFGGDPNIIGQLLRAKLSNLAEPAEAYRIVGVLPMGFRSVRDYARGLAEVVIPLQTRMRTYLVRLPAGVPIALAEQRITAAVRQQATALPPGWTEVKLESVHERYVKELRPMLVAITVAVVLVLTIVGANVAVLMLLRAARRQKELAVRLALGAAGRHIVRLLLIETAVLCVTAMVLGLATTGLVLQTLAPMIEANLGRDAPGGTSAIAIDGTVLVVVAGLGVVMAAVLSCMPVMTLWRRRLVDTLRRDRRTGADTPSSRRMRSVLVTVEVAGSLALLVGCALMVQSVTHMMRAELGFKTDHVVRARIALPARTYPDVASFIGFYDQLIARLPGLAPSSFAFTNSIPFYPAPAQRVEVDGRKEAATTAGVLAVSEAYFTTLSIEMREGRVFTASDRPGAEPVAIVSETLGRRLWPSGSAIGQHLRTAEEPVPGSPLTAWRTVVGVARDVRQTYVDDDLRDVYLPFAQAPSRYSPLFIRTDRPARFWVDGLNAAVAAIDPEVQVTGPKALQLEGDALLSQPKFLTSLLTGFGVFTTLLTLLGIYGVTAYTVSQREREIAIRMALGSSRQGVVQLFLRSGGVLLVAGIAVGLLGAIAVARLLESQLHGVTPFDVTTLMVACALLATTGLLAMWWPVRRATGKDPAANLRDA